MLQPEVIFLDAVGTLFGVKGSVGEVYSTMARSFGVLSSSIEVDAAFYDVFKTTPPLAFPNTSPQDIQKKEFQWWRNVTFKTFQNVGVAHKFLDFDLFFYRLYNHFATAHPWEVYSDVIPCLERWRSENIKLGIISNFDSRLYQVLNALELKHFFSSVTISSEVGAAKPNPKIFQKAIAYHQVSPEQTWHIGDSRREDYEGATSIGMQAFILKRKSLVLQ